MSWQWAVVTAMCLLFGGACVTVLIAGARWTRVKVPRPQLPSKTDREIRQWERFIKTLREGEQR